MIKSMAIVWYGWAKKLEKFLKTGKKILKQEITEIEAEQMYHAYKEGLQLRGENDDLRKENQRLNKIIDKMVGHDSKR